MDLTNDYTYVSSDPFTEKINYSYSKYYGIQFIEIWKEHRKKFIQQTSESFSVHSFITEENDTHSTHTLLDEWIQFPQKINIEQFSLLLKRVEVTKKIFKSYDENFRPTKQKECNDLSLHLKFSCVLVHLYKKTKKFNYLNVLLKVNDIICSEMSLSESIRLSGFVNWVLQEEKAIINELQKTLNIRHD